jgi:hypothetical protein
MDRRRWLWVGGGVVLVLVVAGGIVVKFGAYKDQVGQIPEWLRSHQPAEGIMATPVEPVDPKASWATCRPSPMIAPCMGQGAGRRVRRTYAGNLAGEPTSLINGSVNSHLEVDL